MHGRRAGVLEQGGQRRHSRVQPEETIERAAPSAPRAPARARAAVAWSRPRRAETSPGHPGEASRSTLAPPPGASVPGVAAAQAGSTPVRAHELSWRACAAGPACRRSPVGNSLRVQLFVQVCVHANRLTCSTATGAGPNPSRFSTWMTVLSSSGVAADVRGAWAKGPQMAAIVRVVQAAMRRRLRDIFDPVLFRL